MRCCVLIMGCKVNPGNRNMKAIHDTYIASYFKNKNLFKNEYEFYFYDGGNDVFSVEKYYDYANIIHCSSGDGINSTFEKTIESFEWITSNKNFDWVVRVNISTYINLFYLDVFLQKCDINNVYANRFNCYINNYNYLNDCYPRGDAYILSFNKIKQIVEVSKKYSIREELSDGKTDLVDDVLIGALLIKTFDDLYINHYKLLNYTFLPYLLYNLTKDDIVLSANTIFTRVKTIPPDNFYSGYGWEDNKYRNDDVLKIKLINTVIYNNKNIYKGKEDLIIKNCILEKYNKDIYYKKDFINNEISVMSFNELINYIKYKRNN